MERCNDGQGLNISRGKLDLFSRVRASNVPRS